MRGFPVALGLLGHNGFCRHANLIRSHCVKFYLHGCPAEAQGLLAAVPLLGAPARVHARFLQFWPTLYLNQVPQNPPFWTPLILQKAKKSSKCGFHELNASGLASFSITNLTTSCQAKKSGLIWVVFLKGMIWGWKICFVFVPNWGKHYVLCIMPETWGSYWRGLPFFVVQSRPLLIVDCYERTPPSHRAAVFFANLLVDCTLHLGSSCPCYRGQDAAKKAATEKESFSSMEVGCNRQRNLMFVVIHLERHYNLAVGCQDARVGWKLRCSRPKITWDTLLSRIARNALTVPMAPILSRWDQI